jgi:uncharacterized membrane protein YqjE
LAAESDQKIAQAIQDVSEKAQLLIREEIELAKVEIETKVKSLGRGAVVAGIAGFFVINGLYFMLFGFAFLIWYEVFPGNTYFWGFFVLAAILFLMAALGGFLAFRAFKKGSPPVPRMAISEAQQIRETIKSSTPESSD